VLACQFSRAWHSKLDWFIVQDDWEARNEPYGFLCHAWSEYSPFFKLPQNIVDFHATNDWRESQVFFQTFQNFISVFAFFARVAPRDYDGSVNDK
jgi:hypothetical protein